MKSKADLVRLLWRVLVVAVVVYVVGGFITLFLDGEDIFSPGSGRWRQLVFDAQFMAFRVGAGALALMAGLWLSTRPWDEE